LHPLARGKGQAFGGRKIWPWGSTRFGKIPGPVRPPRGPAKHVDGGTHTAVPTPAWGAGNCWAIREGGGAVHGIAAGGRGTAAGGGGIFADGRVFRLRPEGAGHVSLDPRGGAWGAGVGVEVNPPLKKVGAPHGTSGRGGNRPQAPGGPGETPRGTIKGDDGSGGQGPDGVPTSKLDGGAGGNMGGTLPGGRPTGKSRGWNTRWKKNHLEPGGGGHEAQRRRGSPNPGCFPRGARAGDDGRADKKGG